MDGFLTARTCKNCARFLMIQEWFKTIPLEGSSKALPHIWSGKLRSPRPELAAMLRHPNLPVAFSSLLSSCTPAGDIHIYIYIQYVYIYIHYNISHKGQMNLKEQRTKVNKGSPCTGPVSPTLHFHTVWLTKLCLSSPSLLTCMAPEVKNYPESRQG